MPVPPVPFPINYCNDLFPLLSFAYAVYCGGDKNSSVMDYENKQVRQSLNNVPGYASGSRPTAAQAAAIPYNGYLDYYTVNQVRPFPAASQRIVSVDVITNDVPFWIPPLNITQPTQAQCQAYINELVLELQGAPAPAAGQPTAAAGAQRPARKSASRDDFRPMLSCLSVIFLNDDASFRQNPAAFLADYELSAPAVAALTAFGQRLAAAGVVGPIPAGGPWMTPIETTAVNAELVFDMSKSLSIVW
jgi:hypothetical protein